MEDLGLARGKIMAAVVLASLCPALVALALGAEVVTAGVLFAVTALATAVLAALASRALRRQVWHPLRDMLANFEVSLRGDGSPCIEEHGIPLLRLLSRRLSDTISRSAAQNRLSHAKQLSAEIAFDRIHSVVQSLTDGVIVVGPERRVVLANRVARQVLVDDGRAVEGRPLLDVLDGELAEPVTKIWTNKGLKKIIKEGLPEVNSCSMKH